MRHSGNPSFAAVIFRRTYPQITNAGGLWDEASELYDGLGAASREASLEYRFPSGMTIKFAHMQHAKDRLAWKGAQVPLIAFDQLEDFEESQFWYLQSRNRSARAGVRPYIRGTCNPVPDDDPIGGWLNKLISWWIDPDTGYAIQERSGVLRWFVRLADELHWGDDPQELVSRFPNMIHDDERGKLLPKSFTFIPSLLQDNPALEQADPGYRATLMSLPLVERERLLYGNWKIKAQAGKIFKRVWFKTRLRELPKDVERWVRYWDKAGTEGGGKFSAGALMGKRSSGRFILADMVRGQWSARNREEIIKQTAEADKERFPGKDIDVWVEQEPGSGGKESAETTIINLAGHTVHAERVTGNKVTRAGPLSAQAEAENVDLLADRVLNETGEPWNEAFLAEAENFDGETGFSDQIDAAGGAFNKLMLAPGPVQQVDIGWG
jgi:predicted phage terminase large subunit-like protein